MARLWNFLLGVDQAFNTILSASGAVSDTPQDITISATMGAIAAHGDTPDDLRAWALKWQARIDSVFLLFFSQHCHCADAAVAELKNMHPVIAADIAGRLENLLATAKSCGMKTTV